MSIGTSPRTEESCCKPVELQTRMPAGWTSQSVRGIRAMTIGSKRHVILLLRFCANIRVAGGRPNSNTSLGLFLRARSRVGAGGRLGMGAKPRACRARCRCNHPCSQPSGDRVSRDRSFARQSGTYLPWLRRGPMAWQAAAAPRRSRAPAPLCFVAIPASPRAPRRAGNGGDTCARHWHDRHCPTRYDREILVRQRRARCRAAVCLGSARRRGRRAAQVSDWAGLARRVRGVGARRDAGNRRKFAERAPNRATKPSRFGRDAGNRATSGAAGGTISRDAFVGRVECERPRKTGAARAPRPRSAAAACRGRTRASQGYSSRDWCFGNRWRNMRLAT